jgi:DmsE family decaheme c-type cytochrome
MNWQRLLLPLGLAILLPAAIATAQGAPAAAQKAETPLCADCHDQAAAFPANPHSRIPKPSGKMAVSPNFACESCHGDGAKHMESGGETPLARTFHGGQGTDFCLTCHGASASHESFANGTHALSPGVNCLSCHSVHSSAPKQADLLKTAPTQLCASCHSNQASTLANKPFAHRMGRGDMSCVSCHDPHGKPGRDMLKLTRMDELPCLSCHSEKRGPFVFEHVTGVTGDCLSCHEPHGSSNPHQLTRANVDQLCLECHSPISAGTLGSQPPSIHDLLSPRYRNCTTCHTAVHGSNLSPGLFK